MLKCMHYRITQVLRYSLKKVPTIRMIVYRFFRLFPKLFYKGFLAFWDMRVIIVCVYDAVT